MLLNVFLSLLLFLALAATVQPSRTILAVLVGVIGGTLLCKYFKIGPLPKDEMSFQDFLFGALAGILFNKWNHCSHLGILINKSLSRFDPEVILLLQSKFWLKTTKGLGRDVENWFSKWHLGFSISFSYFFLLDALMLIIKFQFNWIIEEMSKIWIVNIFPI